MLHPVSPKHSDTQNETGGLMSKKKIDGISTIKLINNKSTSLHTIIENTDDIVTILNNKKKLCEKKYIKFKKCQNTNQLIYYVLGGLSVLLSITITTMSGAQSIYDVNNGIYKTLFILSMLVSLLSTALNFFRIESKINEYKTSSSYYFDLYNDIDEILINKTSMEEYRNFYNMVIERIKLIHNTEPSLYDSCLK